MNHLLCQGRALNADPAEGAVVASLHSSVAPDVGAAPGDVIELSLSVAPDERGSYGYAYVLESSLLEAAEILSSQGLEHFPRQRWYRVRADAGEVGTGVLTLRVKEPKKGPRLRPRIMVGAPEGPGRAVARTGKLTGHAVLVRTHTLPGLRVVTASGAAAEVDVLAQAPSGSSAIAVTQPLHGSAELTAGGKLTYQPSPGFTGYDRIEYTVATGDSTKITAAVNVFVGDLGATPGIFPEHPSATGFEPWEWPEITGDMPWPRQPHLPPKDR
ncbi:Ig-like domain-containing protein [Streptomyces sp. NPDC091289]|uniref:Ig-like domain-containing protein n=1 Tax=Streptomyces sp. NPDC091289 TaxID=3365989 RepID=UPI0038085035